MVVPQSSKAEPPEDDDGYFERMTKAIFQAGLNWRMIENKWPNFRNAFDQFSAKRVSSFGEKEVKALMGDTGIVRNERKIRSVIENARESLRLKDEFGSFGDYLKSFKGDERRLTEDLQSRFKHLGESSARTFLYTSGFKLRPTREELEWHSHMKEGKHPR